MSNLLRPGNALLLAVTVLQTARTATALGSFFATAMNSSFAIATTTTATSATLSLLLTLLLWFLMYDSATLLIENLQPKHFHCANSRFPGKDLPPPYPNGWYLVLYSRELARGEVKSVRALGRELTVFRSRETGKPYVVGSYCPHLGANLAVGGKVAGENCVQCPFHGWKISGETGYVMETNEGCAPPAGTAPTDCYLVREVNEMILIYLHGDRDAPRRGRGLTSKEAGPEVPEWEVPVEPIIEKMHFVGIVEHAIPCHIIEIPENGADVSHLNTVHEPFVVQALARMMRHDWKFQYQPGEGDMKHTNMVKMDLGLKAFGSIYDSFAVKVDVLNVGPAIVQGKMTLPFGLGTMYFASSVTPVKPLMQRYTHAMWSPNHLPSFIAKGVLRGLVIQVNRDVPIWTNKTYRNRPPYNKTDANIPRFRRWFSQFYGEKSETFEEAVAHEAKIVELEW